MKTIERFWKCPGWVMALLMLAVGGGWAGGAAGAATESKPLGDLRAALGELRKGGLVIYFRHASTDQSGRGDAAADLARCETQRNLSAKGRDEAAQIGEAMRALRIPVGSVLASPLCRTKDTARLAFGRFAESKDLHFSIGADAREMDRLASVLRRLLTTPPSPGTNGVIVSHSANLREAAGIFPKPEGVAYVFRPLPNGKFEAVARILPEDWGNVARLERGATAR
jgi:broad specificity phosphatase PhoE